VIREKWSEKSGQRKVVKKVPCSVVGFCRLVNLLETVLVPIRDLDAENGFEERGRR
jgi:hypothetical protein